MQLTAIINNYYTANGKLIGTVGENNIGLTVGRFFSAKTVKQVENAEYCELGIKYVLGTKSEKPLGDILKEKLQVLCYEVHIGSAIGKAHTIAKELLGRKFKEPTLKEVKRYKTCTVSRYEWKVMGRSIMIQQTAYPTTQHSELEVL
ncbi:hypothetical protein [Vibrio splendidus]|uniref:hypothetical protein n=1 Tax=Vibrio splendidus TaxID=29497 RepID=UPI003D1281C3